MGSSTDKLHGVDLIDIQIHNWLRDQNYVTTLIQ